MAPAAGGTLSIRGCRVGGHLERLEPGEVMAAAGGRLAEVQRQLLGGAVAAAAAVRRPRAGRLLSPLPAAQPRPCRGGAEAPLGLRAGAGARGAVF
jgi:hypothetical protein